MKPTSLFRQLQQKSIYNDLLAKYINENKNIMHSTVFQGSLYEHVVMRELSTKLLMEDLKKVGGAHDGGVDILAKWDLKKIYSSVSKDVDLSKMYPLDKIPKRVKLKSRVLSPVIHKLTKGDNVEMNVLIQCKSFNKSKVSPREFRELIGTYNALVPPKRWKSCIMVMCSPHLLTPDGLKLINSIDWSLIYLRIGQIYQFSDKSFDLYNSGKLLNYYENNVTSKLFKGCGIQEFLKLGLYDNLE